MRELRRSLVRSSTNVTSLAVRAARPFPDTFLDALPDAVAVVCDGMLVQVNPAFARLTGRDGVEALTGMPFASLLAAGPEGVGRALRDGARVRLTTSAGGDVVCSLSVAELREDGQSPLLVISARNIGPSLEVERALRDSEAQYRSIFDNTQEGIYQTTPDGRYLKVNPALARIYGYPNPRALIDSLTDIAGQLYVDPQARSRFRTLMDTHGLVRDFEAQIRRRDGSVIWITENARCVRDALGRVRYYEGTVEDITSRKQSEEEIRLLAKVFESVAEGILLLDDQGVVMAVNPAYCSLTGFVAEDMKGRPMTLVAAGQHEKGFVAAALRQVAAEGHWHGEVAADRNGGTYFPADVTITAVRNPDGGLSQYVVAVQDITRRKQDEENIRFHANYDNLTRLPNRRLVLERLKQALAMATHEGGRGCVLFLDLDRFKAINDSFGHAAGDELLKLVAQRLKGCVRLSDTVGRLGGDEFIILLPGAGGGNPGVYIAEKVLYTLSEPFTLMGTQQFCIPSIGVAYFPEHGLEVEEVMRAADIAMYHAKQSGGERRYAVYDPAMANRGAELLRLETDLRLAYGRGELELHYQPKVAAGSLSMEGAEALVRWRHPRHGMVSPAQFIPVAEETGLIVPIGRWVLRTACEQVVAWDAQGLTLPSVSVNVSAKQFADPEFIDSVRQVLSDTGIQPSRLDLEITESVMTGDVERAVNQLKELKDLGVTLSIDDFGTGYSSLNYLKTFPIDTLKIDQTFIRDVAASPKDAAIVTTIITLALNLGFSTVAEGVETAEHAAFLRARGVSVFQGYWISRPLAPDAFATFLSGQDRPSPP